jgi:hypothetical protein
MTLKHNSDRIWLSTKEAAAALALHEGTLRTMRCLDRKRGIDGWSRVGTLGVRYRKVGGVYRYYAPDIWSGGPQTEPEEAA